MSARERIRGLLRSRFAGSSASSADPSRVRLLVARLQASGAGAVLLRGASVFLGIQFLAALVGFAVHAVLARTLGAQGYGTYAYALSWVLVLVPLGRLGLGTGSLRFVPAYAARGEWGLLRGFVGFSLRGSMACSIGMAAIAAAAVAVAPGLDPELRFTLWIGCPLLPIYASLQILGPTLRALKRVALSQFAGSLLPQLALGAGVALLLFTIPIAPSPAVVMAINGAALGACLVFSLGALARVLPGAAKAATPESHAGEWLRVVLPLMLINLLNMLMERSSLLVIGSLLGAESAGLYAPAARIAVTISVLLAAVNAWLAPVISELHSQGRMLELQHYVRRGAQLAFGATLPTVLGVIVFGETLLGVFGPEFTAGHRALSILAIGQLVDAFTGPVGLLMSLTGHQATAARILIGVTTGHVLLNLLLAPVFGIEGAAVATAISKIAWNLTFFVIVWKRIGVRSTLL